MSHVYACLRGGFWKRRNITFLTVLERQAGTLPPLPLEQMCRLFYLKTANVLFW